MITGTLSSYKTDTRHRVNLRKVKMHKKQHLVCGDSCLHSKSQEGSSMTTQRSSVHQSVSCNGRMTPTLQYRRRMCSTSKGRYSDSDGSKRAIHRPRVGLNDGVIATCATSTTRWPIARWRMRKHGVTFDGPLILFGAKVSYKPISSKDEAKLYQIDKNMLPGVFMRYLLRAGGGWSGDRGLSRPREPVSLR